MNDSAHCCVCYGNDAEAARDRVPAKQSGDVGLKAQSRVQRIAEFLASRATVDSGSCVITLPFDKVLIASRLGLKPESLSRVFAKLRSVGVAVHAGDVAVSDVAKLRPLAAEERSIVGGGRDTR